MGLIKWYKRDPDAALSGMMDLTLEERGAYNTVLDLIYTRDGKLMDDDRFLAGWMRCDIRVWRRVKKRLIDLGKITVEAGLITNLRATSEVDAALHRVASAREAGLSSAASKAPKSDAKPKENKDMSSTPVATEKDKPLQLTTATTTTTKYSIEEVEGKTESFELIGQDGKEPADCVQAVVDVWNEVAGLVGPVARTAVINDDRRKGVLKLVKDYGLEAVIGAIRTIPDQGFICAGGTDGGWRPGINFLFGKQSFVRLIEGGYAHAPGKKSGW